MKNWRCQNKEFYDRLWKKGEEAMGEEVMNETGQYLTYKLADEVFALDIAKVREVLDYTTVTKVPQTPEFMCGVINLRGNVVPVIDMRLKFGMSKTEQTVNTCIIITEISLEGESTILGALADSVQEVLDLGPEQIEPAPRMGTGLNTEFIKGMGKRDEQFIIILDIDKVFSAEELALAQHSISRADAVDAAGNESQLTGE
jgi:purine-binding chemotaxis protein CheW